MLFDDDDEFLETELCSAESLHYAWPNILLLNSRNALLNSTETSEISIWGEVPLPGNLTKGVINPHLFFLWPLPNWPSEGLSPQASLELSAVLCIPQPCYLHVSRESKGLKATELSAPTPKVQIVENSLWQLHQKEKHNQGLRLQPLINTKWVYSSRD